MKKYFISDFKTGDSLFGEVFAVRQYKKGATRNNKPFIDIELADNSGTIKGKIWSDDMANCEKVEEGDVVSLNGTIEDFMNTPQLRITNLSKTENYDLADLQQKSKFDSEKMWHEISETIDKIGNPHIKKLLNNVFTDDFTAIFSSSTAAYRVHHAYINGLLEHTWEMLKMAKSLKSHYPKLNMDLVNAGIILHDIGKTAEYEIKTAINLTTAGKLMGHIFIGAEKVKNAAPEGMPEDLLQEIIHIVLSHHGELQYGSPVLPKTAEAIAVNALDQASTKINMAYNHIHGNLGDEVFTQYVSQLGTELYRSPYSEELMNEDIPF